MGREILTRKGVSVISFPEPKAEEVREIEISVDYNINLDYEQQSSLDVFRLWIMNLLVRYVETKKRVIPKSWGWFWKDPEGTKLRLNTFFVDGLSRICRGIREGAGGWRALDIIYRFDFGNWFGPIKLLNCFWLKIRNARAVRNRRKLVIHQLVSCMEETYKRFAEVKLLSLACGSAEAVFGACHIFLNKYPRASLSVFFTDINPEAIRHIKKRIDEEGLGFVCGARIANVLNIETLLSYLKIKGFEPNMIEMVGLMDYLEHDSAVELCRDIYLSLPSGGFFVTAHIAPNEESIFLHTILDWEMFHRSPQELALIMKEAGFLDSYPNRTTGKPEQSFCKIIGEPEKIHFVAVGQV